MKGRSDRVNEALAIAQTIATPERYTRKKTNTAQPEEKDPVSAATEKKKKEIDTAALSEIEAIVVSVMDGVMSAEEIAGLLSSKKGIVIAVGELLGVLTMLEIGGYLEALPGGSFQLL